MVNLLARSRADELSFYSQPAANMEPKTRSAASKTQQFFARRQLKNAPAGRDRVLRNLKPRSRSLESPACFKRSRFGVGEIFFLIGLTRRVNPRYLSGLSFCARLYYGS